MIRECFEFMQLSSPYIGSRYIAVSNPAIVLPSRYFLCKDTVTVTRIGLQTHHTHMVYTVCQYPPSVQGGVISLSFLTIEMVFSILCHFYPSPSGLISHPHNSYPCTVHIANIRSVCYFNGTYRQRHQQRCIQK